MKPLFSAIPFELVAAPVIASTHAAGFRTTQWGQPHQAMKAILALPILSLALSVCGCQHERSTAVLQGHTSFEILAPAANPPPPDAHLQTAPSEIEIENVPGCYAEKDLVKPVYPADALAANAGSRVVTVAVSFDEDGKVTDMSPSLRQLSIPDRYSEEFFAAVKAAVMRWRITPPHNVYYQGEPDGQRRYLRTEALATSIDVKFTFEASGQVKQSAPRPQGKPSGLPALPP